MVRGFFGLALAFACAVAFAQDALLDRAQGLIKSKQFKEAYALLEPQEQTRAGDPQFDYLLGIAAIDSGQLTRGVFALERVLAVNPNHAPARAEIARAYFLMGENRTARSEFEAVRASRPPAEVSATVSRFLDALDARERARHTGASGYIELGLGHDSNVNAATASNNFAIPAFGGAVFTLAPAAQKQADWYLGLNAGFSGRWGVTESVGIVASGSVENKSNFDLDQFNTGSLNASAGVSIRRGTTSEWLIAAQGQKYFVENNTFRNGVGGVLQYRNNWTPNDQFSVYGQYTKLTYPDIPLRDANRYVVGVAWAHAYPLRSGSPVVYAGAYAGKEDPDAANVPHFGHNLYGVRVGGQMGLTERWLGTLSANYEERRYGGPDPLFLGDRHDREFYARAAAVYQIDKNWSVTPGVSYTKVTSNFVVNEYDRWMVSVFGRYDFR